MSSARETNRFSNRDGASSRVFVGYGSHSMQAPGAWKLDDIAACWSQCNESPPSFWVVGERELGKTSVLQHLMSTVARKRHDGERTVVPLFVRCREVSSILEFYHQLFASAPAGSGLAITDVDASSSPFEILDTVLHDLGNLVERLSSPEGPRARVVLLIDDVTAIAGHPWAPVLFDHLRTLIRGGPWPRQDGAARSEDVALAVAGERDLENVEGAPRLLATLEEFPLRALDYREVSDLIGQQVRGVSALFPRWVFRVTAGHPWLVQFVMDAVASLLARAGKPDEPELETLVATRVRESEEYFTVVFQRYLDNLPSRGREVLMHLVLGEKEGLTVDAVASKTAMPARAVRAMFELMLNLGLVNEEKSVDVDGVSEFRVIIRSIERSDFAVPGASRTAPAETTETPGRYFLGDIFRRWFLEHTGGVVLMNEVRQLRSTLDEERRQLLNVPFTLTLSTAPPLLIADGLYTRVCPLEQSTRRMLDLIMTVVGEEKRNVLNLVANQLDSMLRKNEWAQVWSDYVEHARQEEQPPRFVLRVANKELFQFPIELLTFNHEPLGLESPVYKELMTELRKPAYRLSRTLLPEKDVNVLIVGSSRGDEMVPSLEFVEREVVEIVSTLRQRGGDAKFRVGNITVLTPQPGDYGDDVRREPLSPASFENALSGKLGIPFHIVHYCGHYTPSENDTEGGFWVHDGTSLRLFNVSQWSHALKDTTIRMVCLNACVSASIEENANLYQLGAAHAALMAGVPVFIGMRTTILDSTAYEFSRPFYSALLRHGLPEDALFHTRRTLNHSNPTGTAWAAPVMLTR